MIELSPGGGYWTEILAPYAKATGGRYVATGTDLANPDLSAGAKAGRAAFEKRFADPAVYGPVTVVNFGPKAEPARRARLGRRGVHLAQHPQLHLPAGMLDKVLADAFAVLKPGGVLGVEEHRADPRPEAKGNTDGYVSEAT